MNKIKLEICCGSAEDAIEAYKAGTDRVELSSNLFHGGRTPTIGSSTANIRSIFYGSCLYPPEDRFNVTYGAYIGRIAKTLERIR